MERWDQAFQPVEAPPGAEAFDWAPTQAEQEMLDRLGYERSQFTSNRWVYQPPIGPGGYVTVERNSDMTWSAMWVTRGSIRYEKSHKFASLLALLSWLEIEGARHG